MEGKSVVYIVGICCKPEQEAKFNKWYDEVYIPMLFKYAGMAEVRRWKLASGQ